MEDEDARADALLTRGDMEAAMVVSLAGRCAEKLVMGESEVGSDLGGQVDLEGGAGAVGRPWGNARAASMRYAAPASWSCPPPATSHPR